MVKKLNMIYLEKSRINFVRIHRGGDEIEEGRDEGMSLKFRRFFGLRPASCTADNPWHC